MGLKEGIFKLAERAGYARLVDTLKGLRDSSRNDFYEPDAWLLNLAKG